uniref:Leucine-rich repeat-containing G-protein coupled receptor 6 n=1 Tax=Ceratitis capitata TaxID=7213 RepID=W8B7S9_CERCA
MLAKRKFANSLLFIFALCLLAPRTVHSAEAYDDDTEDSSTVEESVELSLLSAEVIDGIRENTAETTTTTATSTMNLETTTTTTQLANDVEKRNDYEDIRPQLRYIKTLDDNCLEGFCYNFHYGDLNEVAFFDVKTEVRINKDETTYDIVNARNYDTLVFENSTFARFPLHLFYAVSVKELDVRNCSIKAVTWECFLMAQGLRILLLSNNRLESIEPGTFDFANDLQYLFLDSNRLSNLQRESFKGLTQLRYLEMSRNQLTELPNGLFDTLTALEELRLDDNRLRKLTNKIFPNNLNLLILSAGANRLEEIEDHTFRRQDKLIILDVTNNPELRTLVLLLQLQNLAASNCALTRVNIYGYVRNVDLSNNRITELYFAQPDVLTTLSLRNNSLEQIASLSRATNLQVLELCDNPNMSTLPSPWLANSLTRLNLGNTGLKQLPVEAIAEQTQLIYLNVSHNHLREINPQNFKYLENLTRFDIRGNDWNCYNLNVLMDMLLKPHAIIYGNDDMDAEFPGEYINGIACMYRIENWSVDDSAAAAGSDQQTMESMGNTVFRLAQLQKQPQEEVESLRRELKAIVSIYEQKFDRAFQLIEDLNARLRAFENLNATLFQHVTITV